MCDTSMDKYSNIFIPDKPLKFIRVTEIHDDNKLCNVLKLCCSPQQIIFKNAECLVNNCITYVIPKIICGKDKKIYKIEPPQPEDIIIQDENTFPLDITINEIKSLCAYYITFKIPESCNCEVIIFVILLTLKLTLLPCYDKKICCHDKNYWKWIVSSLVS